MSLRVLAVASELYPLVKTGGLADVAGALPAALAAHEIETRTLLPGYPQVLEQLEQPAELHSFDDLFGGAARLRAGRAAGHELFVLDAPHLYARPGDPYRGPDGLDWGDNPRRFAALSWTAAAIARGLLEGYAPDILHAHDWQAGLAPAYLALADGARPATVMTVHNLAFQGQCDPALLYELRLPAQAFSADGVEYYGAIGFLKAGLFYADRLSTVSPTYAREIQGEAGGMGLGGLLRSRAGDLVGIVNGIDEAVWDPRRDPHLAKPYGPRDAARQGGPAGKAACRAALLEQLGLGQDPDGPLFAVVSRLTWQKGMDLLLAALPEMLALGGRLVLLGSGEPGLEHGFREAAARQPDRIACVFGYDEPLAHRIYAAADVMLVPSRFEPCGLSQLIALRYGAPPLVARTGGLADTVIDANAAALADGVATGLQVAPGDAPDLAAGIARATELYRDRACWNALRRRAMTRDVGWEASAARYAALYRGLAEPTG